MFLQDEKDQIQKKKEVEKEEIRQELCLGEVFLGICGAEMKRRALSWCEPLREGCSEG